MKKLFCLICAVLLVFALCVLPALATDNGADDLIDAEEIVTEPDKATPGKLPEKFSWEYLVTTGGAAIFAFAVAQYAKVPLDKVWKIPTRLLVYILSFITLLVANYFLSHGLNIETVALSVFNALISAFGAYGMYEVWVRKKE